MGTAEAGLSTSQGLRHAGGASPGRRAGKSHSLVRLLLNILQMASAPPCCPSCVSLVTSHSQVLAVALTWASLNGSHPRFIRNPLPLSGSAQPPFIVTHTCRPAAGALPIWAGLGSRPGVSVTDVTSHSSETRGPARASPPWGQPSTRAKPSHTHRKALLGHVRSGLLALVPASHVTKSKVKGLRNKSQVKRRGGERSEELGPAVPRPPCGGPDQALVAPLALAPLDTDLGSGCPRRSCARGDIFLRNSIHSHAASFAKATEINS